MTDATASWGYEPSNNERLLAALAHIAIFIVPVVGPLVLYLVQKDTSKYVAYHALQATVFQLIAYVVGPMIFCVGILIGYVMAVMWAMKANQGEWTGYPIIESMGAE